MKLRIFAALLALVLVFAPLCAVAENQLQYELLPTSKLVTAADDPILYVTGGLINTSDTAISAGYGTAVLCDGSGATLYTGRVHCLPEGIPPGEKGYFSLTVPINALSDPTAEAADWVFDFSPSSSKASTTLPAEVEIDPSIREISGCPVTLTIRNTTGKAMQNFHVGVVLLNQANGELLYMPEIMHFYNRLPAQSHVQVKCFLPDGVMERILEQELDYTAVGCVWQKEE